MNASTDYARLTADQFAAAAAALAAAWDDPRIATQQRVLVDAELARLRAGEQIPTFAVFAELVRSITPAPRRVLDVGCASGYYHEVLRLCGWSGEYLGVDCGEPLVELARRCYPEARFEVRDAADLGDVGEHDLVISSACLLHVPRWPDAVAAAARAARPGGHVLFHRTPVTNDGAMAYWQKAAYGVPCVEQHFSAHALLDAIARAGLRVVADRHVSDHGDYAMRAYLCVKEPA